MIGGYRFYNGAIGIQSEGAIILSADNLDPNQLVYVVNEGPQVTVTTLGNLAAFLGVGNAEVDLVASGNQQDTAFKLPGSLCVFTNVPANTACAIPVNAQIGSTWEVWNAGFHNLPVFPPPGMQIQTFGTNNSAVVLVGGSSRFIVASMTQVYAR